MGSAKEFDLEGCAALEPDLVVLPQKLKDAAETLEGLGIDVLLVNPENQQQLTEMIELIAAATNTQERAAAAGLHSQAAERAENPAGGCADPERLSGGQLRPALHRRKCDVPVCPDWSGAGGVNVAAELEDSYWAQVDYEQLMS